MEEKEFKLDDLKELLTIIVKNQNEMALKLISVSNAIIEIQEIIKNGKRI